MTSYTVATCSLQYWQPWLGRYIQNILWNHIFLSLVGCSRCHLRLIGEVTEYCCPLFQNWFQEAYGGFSSALIWLFVIHSAQREIRERHHYTVDCVVAIYVGILLWKMTGYIWPVKDASRGRRLTKLEKIQGRLIQAAKDSDMDKVRELLEEVEIGSQESQNKGPNRAMWVFACATIFSALTIVLLAFTWTSDGWFIFILRFSTTMSF